MLQMASKWWPGDESTKVARGSLEFFEQKLQNVKMVFLKEEGFLYVCEAAASL